MPRITSFTEKALLNNFVLDLLYPPNCEKKKITQIGNSVIETLKEINCDHVKKGFLHWGTKPLRCIARGAFVGIVAVTVSPLGIFYYGTLTGVHLANYSFRKYIQGANTQHEKWEKISQYASAFFSDLFYFSAETYYISSIYFGFYFYLLPRFSLSDNSIILSKLGINSPIKALVKKVIKLAIGFLGLAYLGDFMSSGGFSETLSRLLGDSKSKTGMYLALKIRNQFGIVNQDGDLLQFSSEDALEDALEYKKRKILSNQLYLFERPVNNKLIELILAAELALIDRVRKANQWLVEKNLAPIAFTYPFNGKSIAKTIEQAVQIQPNLIDSQFHQLINNLRKMDDKIHAFRNLYVSSQQLVMKGSVMKELLLPKDIPFIIPPPSYIRESSYKQYFINPHLCSL
jgi:hypothetical protein